MKYRLTWITPDNEKGDVVMHNLINVAALIKDLASKHKVVYVDLLTIPLENSGVWV